MNIDTQSKDMRIKYEHAWNMNWCMNLHNLHVLIEITNLFFDENTLNQRTQSPPTIQVERESV